MPVVDSYSPCPCGSGQKYKWCCQKIEAYADRSERLFDGGQVAAAIETLNEGLRKEPDNAWLLTRKAVYLAQKNEPQAAKDALRRVFRKQPRHLSALILMTRLVLETEGSIAGVVEFQRAMSAFEPAERKSLASLALLVGAFLAEDGRYPSALKHLRLEQRLGPSPDSKGGAMIRMIMTNPGATPWQKNDYRLHEPPDGLPVDLRERFAQALGWAEEGLWGSAASAFELLSAEGPAAHAAEHNLALCHLWMADDPAAAEVLARYLAREGTTTQAVDLAALYQEIMPLGPDDVVEQLQWIWPIRDFDGLMKRLRDDPTISEDDPEPIDPDDPRSTVLEQFAMLDRPMIEAKSGLDTRDIPRIVARLFLSQDTIALESFDDGRLDALGHRLTALAGPTIAQAHPKTSVLGTVPRSTLAVTLERLLPEGLDPDELIRLTREQHGISIREDWPRTPMPFLGGRTPLEAAADGNAEVALRAAVLQIEQSRSPLRDPADFRVLREMLKLPGEPEVDPETVDLSRLHLSRLAFVPVERLDDERLVQFYILAKSSLQVDALSRATQTLIDRPSATTSAGIALLVLYSDMVILSSGRGDFAEAFEWVRRGRQSDPTSSRVRNAPIWDMLEIGLKGRSQPPETWVPDLAVILDRYGKDPDANQTIMMALVDMGLIRLVPGSNKPGDMMVDPRPLQALLSQYGPRVTTASGQLGVAATQGEIWTPGGSTSSAGGIWTPGSAPSSAGAGAGAAPPPPGGEKPRLIIPGR